MVIYGINLEHEHGEKNLLNKLTPGNDKLEKKILKNGEINDQICVHLITSSKSLYDTIFFNLTYQEFHGMKT